MKKIALIILATLVLMFFTLGNGYQMLSTDARFYTNVGLIFVLLFALVKAAVALSDQEKRIKARDAEILANKRGY